MSKNCLRGVGVAEKGEDVRRGRAPWLLGEIDAPEQGCSGRLAFVSKKSKYSLVSPSRFIERPFSHVKKVRLALNGRPVT